jgi:hypothetical protein
MTGERTDGTDHISDWLAGSRILVQRIARQTDGPEPADPEDRSTTELAEDS